MKTVLISDTHGKHRQMLHRPPKCDLLIAAGDITGYGEKGELRDFLNWATEFASDAIIVAGNHDRCFEVAPQECREMCERRGFRYLQDESCVIEDMVFYGSPRTPKFYDWHFMYERDSDEAEEIWSWVPAGVDVLVTHGPRKGVLDMSPYTNAPEGCDTLKRHVERRVRPRYHVFGHMHSNYGFIENRYSGIVSYNVAICDEGYNPCRKPVVLNLKKKGT